MGAVQLELQAMLVMLVGAHSGQQKERSSRRGRESCRWACRLFMPIHANSYSFTLFDLLSKSVKLYEFGPNMQTLLI